MATTRIREQSTPLTVAGVEVERQWRAHPRLRLPATIGAWQAIHDRDDRLVDHYYDTSDMQLAGQRARLRLRCAGPYEVATLKRRVTSSGGLRRSIEIEGSFEEDPETSVAFAC